MASDVIHIRDIREIRVQHITREINGWNTNFTNYTNTLQRYLSTFGLFVKSVFNTKKLMNFLNTNSANDTNPAESLSIHIRDIREIRVQH